MGFTLCKAVTVGWGHLSGNAYKVLMNMAYTARDDEGLYYGGWERLAFGMGRFNWPRTDDDSPAAQRLIRSHQRAVETALTEVVREGAAVRVTPGGNGRRAVYRLTLTPPSLRVRPLFPVDDAVDNPSTTPELPHGFRASSPTESVGQPGSCPTENVGPRNKSLGTREGTYVSTSPRHLREVG